MLPPWMRFIIYTLAVYRYTLLLHEDDGPWHIFTRLRARAGLWQEVMPPDTEWGEHAVAFHKEGMLAEVMDCPYCLSGWLAIVAAIGYVTRSKVLGLLALIGAIWAIPHYLYKRLGY